MYNTYFKRLFDLLFSILALPFLILIIIIVGPIIYFEDRGPIFYNSVRIGKNGKIFKMYKLRSMKVNANSLENLDKSLFDTSLDQRITSVGRFLRKTSLDEAPQLINIILGDMSIIGPRPDLPEETEQYAGDDYRKLEVRPGVTGYNQAYFRNSIPFKERLKNDLYYIDHLTCINDIKIFFKTAVMVLRQKNIFVEQVEEVSELSADT